MKLGPHVIYPTGNAIEWARIAPVVKSLDSTGAIRAARTGAITIHRAYFAPYEQDALDVDLVFNRIMSQLNGWKPSYIELLNEFRQRVEWGLESYMAFTAACVQKFHAVGLKVAGISNSTGQPDFSDVLFMANYSPPFAGIDAWAKHEYWAGVGFSTWNALRYRRDHELLNGRHPPIIITECGRDAVEGGAPGWKLQNVDGAHYTAELLAYNAEIEKDDYVLGATTFTAGANGLDWWAFDTDEISYNMPGGLPPRTDWSWEDSMAWNRHTEFDAWNKAFGGQGYNPGDAFGKIISANPDKYFGAFVGPYRDSGDIITGWTTVGIFWYDKRTGKADFATAEAELPLA